jgi:hypothetical protein
MVALADRIEHARAIEIVDADLIDRNFGPVDRQMIVAALRSTARTGPDVAGFEACREAAIAIARQAGEPYAINANTGAMMFRAVTEKIAAAIAALPAPATASGGWQPIETAPKDGTTIDVWCGNSEFPNRLTDVKWRKPTESEWFVHGGDGMETPEAQWLDPLGWPMSGDDAPTHWMSLPAAPTITRKSKNEERS